MNTVWKFPIEIIAVQGVMMPPRAEIIHAGLDPAGDPCVWARVNPTTEKVERSICVTGTGGPIPEGENRHVGSFTHGPFVWHVWESAKRP